MTPISAPLVRRVLLVALVLALLSAYIRGGDQLSVANGAAPTTTSTSTSTSTTTIPTTTTAPSTTSTTTPPSTTAAPATSTAAAQAAPGPTPPATEPPSPTTIAPPATVGDGSRVVMLGDSVMLGAQADLEALAGWAVAVDASVSRQVGPPYSNNGIDALAADRLPGDGRVVIHLGTNGLFSESQLDEIMQLLADVPRVVFLTVRIPNYPDIEAANNAMLAGAPSRYPQIVVVDWKGASDANPSWIGSDGIHLTGEGRQAYAALIAAAL